MEDHGQAQVRKKYLTIEWVEEIRKPRKREKRRKATTQENEGSRENLVEKQKKYPTTGEVEKSWNPGEKKVKERRRKSQGKKKALLGFLAWLFCLASLLGFFAWLLCLASFLGFLAWLPCLASVLGSQARFYLTESLLKSFSFLNLFNFSIPQRDLNPNRKNNYRYRNFSFDKKPTLKNYRFYSSRKIIAFTVQPENVDPSPSPLRAYLPSSFCLFEQAGRHCVIAPGLSRFVWELDLRPQKWVLWWRTIIIIYVC